MNIDDLSRRSFLSTVASAAAGVTLAAGAARAADAAGNEKAQAKDAAGAGGDARPLRWGIIGTGARGVGTHIPVLEEAPDAELVALCDVSEPRLKTAVKRARRPVASYADYRQLLANKDVDAVVIATPNLMHREHLLAAVAAGKHVLCEKPAGATPADAAAIAGAAAAARTVVMFGMQYRNHANHRKVRQIVESGEIGRPRYVVQHVSRGDWNRSANIWEYADPRVNGGRPVNWRLSHAASGGTLNEFSCHYLDLVHWIVGGVPERVACDGGISVYRDGRDTWDHATLTMRYPGDVTAVHTLCMFGPGRVDLRVFGDAGSIEAQGDKLLVTSFTKPAGAARRRSKTREVPPDEQPDAPGADDATLGLYVDFLACVRTGKAPDADAARAVAASHTCWLAERAAERKTELKWNELG